MLSYKQYKALNESVMPSFALGLASHTNLGINSPFASFEEAKKVAKKKAKKKMFGDDEETGDGEMVPPASEKDEPDVDVEVGEEEAEDEDCGCKSMSKKKSKKTSKKKMWADEDDAQPEDEESDDSEEESEEEIEDGEEEEVPEGPCKADDVADEESGVALAGKGSPKELSFSKKKAKKSMKKESAEQEWWDSLNQMMGSSSDYKYSTELTPIDVNSLTQAVRQEPRQGSFFG